VKNIAKTINKIIREEKCDGWHLAAEKAINGQIVDCLDAEVKAKLEKNIAADFTKVEKSEIITGSFDRDRGTPLRALPLPHHPACGSAPGGSRS